MKEGQKVVCIKSHRQGLVIKDTIYTIKQARRSICNCGTYLFDVGVLLPNDLGLTCGKCGALVTNDDAKVWWISSTLFVPLEDYTNMEKLIQSIDEPIEA